MTSHHRPSHPVHRSHRPTRPAPGRRVALALSAVLAAGALVACGDDESDAADPSPDATAGTTASVDTTVDTAVDTAIETVCDDYATITGGFLAGQADPADAPAVLDRFAEQAPAEIGEAAATIRTGLTALFGGDESVFEDAAFTGALSDAGDHLFRACPSSARAEVSANDYSFTGLPDELPAGRLALRMINASASGEPHELILLRRPDGDTTPLDELAHLPMDEMMGTYEMAGVVFADRPATANTAFIDLAAGSYIAICTIPVAGNDTTTHAMAGMISELEVTA